MEPAKPPLPDLFGRWGWSNIICTVRRSGPILSSVLKRHLTYGVGALVTSKERNAHALAATRLPTGRHAGAYVIGLNRKFPALAQLEALLDALLAEYDVPEIVHGITQQEVALFDSDTNHPEGEVQLLFGKPSRFKTLMALHMLGGEYDLGKLLTSVHGLFPTRVRRAAMEFVQSKVLVKVGITVRFNEQLSWMPHLRALLDALAPLFPEIAQHASHAEGLRSVGSDGSGRSAGLRFHLFGSRPKQAILAYLAAYGPSPEHKILPATNAGIVDRISVLVSEGLVCTAPLGRRAPKVLYSLNAAHPLYTEIRSLLRTEVILQESLPTALPAEIYSGSDLAEAHAFLPYELFGAKNKTATVSILAAIAHAKSGAITVTEIARFSPEFDERSVLKALRRLRKYGVVSRRMIDKAKTYELNTAWGAYSELYALLRKMGEVWPEFKDAAAV